MSLYLNQIEQLVALQEVDNQMFVIEEVVKNIPLEVEKLQQQHDAVNIRRERLLERIEYIKAQEKRLVNEIDDDTSRLKKSKNKLMQVSNTREFNAVNREMENMERSARSLEEDKMALSEELQRLDAELESCNLDFSSVNAKLTAKKESLETEVAKAKKELISLEKKRQVACGVVPAPVLSRYDFIRRRLANPVIVAVKEHGICMGCCVSIPPQSYIELQKGTQILSCPNCQRLIYWSDHFYQEKPSKAEKPSKTEKAEEAEADAEETV